METTAVDNRNIVRTVKKNTKTIDSDLNSIQRAGVSQGITVQCSKRTAKDFGQAVPIKYCIGTV